MKNLNSIPQYQIYKNSFSVSGIGRRRRGQTNLDMAKLKGASLELVIPSAPERKVLISGTGNFEMHCIRPTRICRFAAATGGPLNEEHCSGFLWPWRLGVSYNKLSDIVI
jgi:hypothetical protein